MRKATWLALLGVAGTAVPARAQEGGGGGPLSVDGGLVIWTLVVFAMLLYVLKRSAWPVLLAAVREREQRLERQLAEAEKQRQEAAALLEEQKRLLAAGHAEAQEIIAKARVVAEKEREALLARAREEYDQLLVRARKEIAEEKEKALLALRREAVDLTIAAEPQGTEEVERYGRLLDAVAGAVQADERIAVALESPRVAKATKAELLARALEDVAPPPFVRFLQAVVRRGRQGLIGQMAREYQGLVDVKLNRVHAGVTLVEEPDDRLEQQIVARLTEAIGKDVRAHFRAERSILGGVIVRVGDRIFDGSVRRKLATLRRKMLTGE